MNTPGDNEQARRLLECGDSSPLSPAATGHGDTNAPERPSQIKPLNAVLVARPVAQRQSGDKSPHSKEVTLPSDLPRKPWPHAPVHKLSEHGVYLVTAGTLHKQRLFNGPERLSLLEGRLLALANRSHWQIEAWAVFPNHYHFVARGNPESANLRRFITHLHADTSRELNRLDGQPGRKVWHNFWDTKLTFEKSYLARLNYVHQNAVKHGIVPVANQYRWCSAAWLERVATPAMVQTIYSFKTDQVEVLDDF